MRNPIKSYYNGPKPYKSLLINDDLLYIFESRKKKIGHFEVLKTLLKKRENQNIYEIITENFYKNIPKLIYYQRYAAPGNYLDCYKPKEIINDAFAKAFGNDISYPALNFDYSHYYWKEYFHSEINPPFQAFLESIDNNGIVFVAYIGTPTIWEDFIFTPGKEPTKIDFALKLLSCYDIFLKKYPTDEEDLKIIDINLSSELVLKL